MDKVINPPPAASLLSVKRTGKGGGRGVGVQLIAKDVTKYGYKV